MIIICKRCRWQLCQIFQLKILEDVYFNPNETGFLFAKDNQALHDEVDRVLKEMKADGTLKEISEKYFQTDVSVPSDKEIQKVEK